MLHREQTDPCANGQHSLDSVGYFKMEDMEVGGRCVGVGESLRNGYSEYRGHQNHHISG